MMWAGRFMLLENGTTFNVAVAPSLCTDDDPPKAFAVRALCPLGCVHLIAFEADEVEAMATAASRLMLADTPDQAMLLTIHPIPASLAEQWLEEAAALNTSWRGTAH